MTNGDTSIDSAELINSAGASYGGETATTVLTNDLATITLLLLGEIAPGDPYEITDPMMLNVNGAPATLTGALSGTLVSP